MYSTAEVMTWATFDNVMTNSKFVPYTDDGLDRQPHRLRVGGTVFGAEHLGKECVAIVEYRL